MIDFNKLLFLIRFSIVVASFAESQVDVLLHAIPIVDNLAQLLPGREVQQESNSAARQVVLQLPRVLLHSNGEIRATVSS